MSESKTATLNSIRKRTVNLKELSGRRIQFSNKKSSKNYVGDTTFKNMIDNLKQSIHNIKQAQTAYYKRYELDPLIEACHGNMKLLRESLYHAKSYATSAPKSKAASPESSADNASAKSASASSNGSESGHVHSQQQTL